MISPFPTKTFIKNRAVLSEIYIPKEEELLYRNEAIKEMGIYFSYFFQKDAPPHILILGSRGTGKTALVRSMLEALITEVKKRKEKGEIGKQETLGYIGYTLKPKNAISCLVNLCKWMGFEIPARGLSLRECIDRWQEKVGDKISIMVIDEIDTLPEKDLNELLYFLSRLGKTCVIAISQRIPIMERITDPSTLSTFKPRVIVLNPYTAQQLKGILKKRAEIAFYPNVLTEKVLNLCAALASQIGGDCRYAIQLLQFGAEKALEKGAKELKEEHIRAAQKITEHKYLEESIIELSNPHKILLYLIVPQKEIDTISIYKEFNFIISKLGYDLLTSRRIRDYLHELQNLGYIEMNVRGEGQRQGVKLYASPTTWVKTSAKDLRNILEKKLFEREE